jgi:LuxR family maltose regulon positive regulatory protein
MSDGSLFINISKISPPNLPPVLNRPRLLDLLEKNRDKRIILILGQAAQGKTTLAASYVKTSKIPSAWVNLDKGDSDPVKLFNLIVGSLQHVLRDMDFSQVSSYSYSTMDSRPEIYFFRECVGYIFKDISIPIQIAMDGLDQLSPDTPAFKFLQVLFEDAPPNIHWMLLSRECPPCLELQQLKMRQEALVLTNEQLAFTRGETVKFLKEIQKKSFNADELEKIYLATEGWVGGLVLLAEYINQFPDVSGEKDVWESLPGYFKAEVFQYFAQEIFSFQPKQVQEFLIKSSIIDLIEPDFMKDFIGAETAEEILWGCHKRNLFVQAYHDEKKGWLFQFHQFFREFLRTKFESEVSYEEKRFYLLKAGQIYKHRQELENAVTCFLEAKAYPEAISAIERLGADLLRKGRRDDVAQWIRVLPENIIEENPWLLLCQAMIRQFLIGEENVRAIEKAYILFKEKGDTKGILLSLAHLIEVAMPSGTQLQSLPLELLLKEGERILESADSNRYQYERAKLWYCLGLGLIEEGSDIRKGIQACQNAYLISKGLGDISLQAYAMTFSMLGFLDVGEYALADETCRKIEEIISKSVYSELQAIQILFQCFLEIHLGNFVKADALVQRLQTEIDKHGFLSLYPWIYEVSGELMLVRGEFKEAKEIADRLLEAATSFKNAHLRGHALQLLGRIYLDQGYFKKAERAVGRALEIFSKEYPSKFHLNTCRLLNSLICCHLKNYSDAEERIEEALKYFKENSSYHAITTAHFVAAFIKRDQGKNDEAALHLETGFKIAEETKCEHFHFLSTKYLMKACLLALELDVVGGTDWVTRFLSAHLSSMGDEEFKKLSNHRDLKIREKIRKVRITLHRSKVPRIYIETLGGFRLIKGESPIEDKEWDRSQPKQLLKAVITHGSRKVSKDLLIEDLWPEETPRATQMAFDVTLHRLRRILEPKIERDFGSSYIHLKEGLVSLDPELCKLDIDKFLSFLKRGEEKEKEGDIKGALSLYLEATEQYRGDFLLEDLYCQRIEVKREELKGKYINLIHKIANLYEKQGALKKAIFFYKRAVQKDPLLEESYQKLMVLYSQQKKRNEALKVYEECKKALWDGLEAEPDQLTVAIYKRILGNPSPY